MKRWVTLTAVLAAITLAGCEKAVEFKLNDVQPKLVVEATIENGRPPMVFLSKSVGYFSNIDLDQVMNSFVHNAEVYISNGTKTQKLKEFNYSVGAGYYFYYYSSDPSTPAVNFLGELNRHYTMRIVSDGKEYTAETTIPKITRRIDSFYWKPAQPGNPPEKVMVMLKAYDPPGFGDYVRYFTQRNSEPEYPGLNSVYDDQVIDGSQYEVQVERGVDRSKGVSDGFSYFDKGDTVTLRLSNIDKATYDFWRTMEFTYASVGNPFSSPTKVISNVSGGALGYFGGYASQYRSIIIPK